MTVFFSPFSNKAHLIAAFSTRHDGDMKLSGAQNETEKQRHDFFKKNNISSKRVVSILAAHGADVIDVGEREVGSALKRVDGLITTDKNVFLSVTAADCLAVYLYDEFSERIGLLHAGWRGLARGIIAKALHRFSDPSRVLVAVGPFIQSCHFEVQGDVAAAFSSHAEAIIERDEKIFIDLGAVVLRQLLEAGVNSEYIEISETCTACSPELYFSYRRDGEPLQAMVAIFGMKSH